MAEKTFLDNFTPKQAFSMGIVLTLLSLGTLGFLWSLRGAFDRGDSNAGIPESAAAAVESSDSVIGQPTPESRVRPVDTEDHIRGDADAPITIIEYSDFECPFCGEFHPTLKRLVAEHDDVRWVYRHFPLSSIHPDAQEAAEAAECAAEQDEFWAMTDEMFENASLGLSRDRLSVHAENVGLDVTRFDECVDSRRYVSKVRDDAADAEAAGATGTPFTVVVVDGKRAPISGAVPLAEIRRTIESLR